VLTRTNSIVPLAFLIPLPWGAARCVNGDELHVELAAPSRILRVRLLR
jgi:hypothetical protein